VLAPSAGHANRAARFRYVSRSTAADGAVMISAADIRIGYGGEPVLAGVSLTAETGSTVGLVGPNGSGKSTLLRVIYRALRPRHGTVLIDGTAVSALSGRELAGRLAVVSQESPAETLATAADMVMLGRTPWAGAVRGYSRGDHVIRSVDESRCP
jgi:iron complex transport system ATP-binding protein